MNSHKIRDKDYQFGKEGENNIYNKLKLQGYKVKKLDRYSQHDFIINDKYIAEHKTRKKISKDTFDTTIFPYSKWTAWKNIKDKYKDCIFTFSFNDGNFFIKCTDIKKYKKQGIKFQIKPFTRYSGFTHAERRHLFIPTNLLKPLEQMVLE